MLGHEMIDSAINNAYDTLMGAATLDEIAERVQEMIFMPDPEMSDKELGTELIEYYEEQEEYERCANIRDLIHMMDFVNETINE